MYLSSSELPFRSNNSSNIHVHTQHSTINKQFFLFYGNEYVWQRWKWIHTKKHVPNKSKLKLYWTNRQRVKKKYNFNRYSSRCTRIHLSKYDLWKWCLFFSTITQLFSFIHFFFPFLILFRRAIVVVVIRKKKKTRKCDKKKSHTNSSATDSSLSTVFIWINVKINTECCCGWSHIRAARQFKNFYTCRKKIYTQRQRRRRRWRLNTNKSERTCARTRREGEKWKRKWMRTIQQSEEWQSPKNCH